MDPAAFAREAHAVHGRLVRVGFALCGDEALAEECAQEALLRAWARVDRGEELASLEAWTVTVALNACRSRLRRRGAEARAYERWQARTGSHGHPASDARLSHEVHDAVLRLPMRQREVVVLHYLLDQDLATIATTTGISVGAVKNALFHARGALATRLAHVVTPTTEEAP
jgi:RNA polymerase sigma-70 factor (ECF subfamily)